MMTIIFFTQEDPFYVKIFFDEFLKHYQSLDEIKAIVISHAMGKKSALDLAKQMFAFYGPVNFLRVGVKYVYVKLMSKKDFIKSPAGKVPKTYSIKQTATVYGIDVIERSDLNSKGFLSMISEFDADLFISVASPIIFKKDLIAVPRIDCINIHNAPLPNYRGMMPNFWQLYHGEKEVGITVHRIASGIDTGDILLQHFLPVEGDETLDHLIRKTKKENARLIIQVIDDFRNGRVNYKKMEGKGSYFTFPTKEDVKEFKRRGKNIL
jgi:methionyl-tRNA formyltransferase